MDSDAAACDAMGIDIRDIRPWDADPGYVAVREYAFGNKREAFRILGTHLLPKALRKINELLDSSSPRAVTQGLNLLLRTQALLIDKVQKQDPGAVNALIASLRDTKTITVVEGSYREVDRGD